MKKNPLRGLVESRKFWLAMLDIIVSIALYFVGKYVGGEILTDMKFLIGILQPVVIMVIYAIAKEDAALKSNGNYAELIKAGLL